MDRISEYRHQNDDQQSRQSPSPTNNGLQTSRTPYTHKRRDSDTLRNVPRSSPTIVEPNRVSPPGTRLQVRRSPPGVTKGRVSPPSLKSRDSPAAVLVKGRTSPPGVNKGRLSPAIAGNPAREIARHRRSPTAPEPRGEGSEYGFGERERKFQQPQHAVGPPPQSAPAIPQASGPAPPPPAQLNRHIVVRFYVPFTPGTFFLPL